MTFAGKMMSLLFNMLSRFIMVFLPKSKCLFISWLQSLSAVIFGAQENEICHQFHLEKGEKSILYKKKKWL